MPNGRMTQLQTWLNNSQTDFAEATLSIANSDASFRQYFRATTKTGHTAIVMDAPPDKEPLGPFLDITQRLREAGLSAPEIITSDQNQGFILLEDFGHELLFDRLKQNKTLADYQTALQLLQKIQQASTSGLPEYDDKKLRFELELMPEWFLKHHFSFQETEIPRQLLDDTFESLCKFVLAQPKTFVHRDYHSRNIMCLEGQRLGIIDYQDAVYGPFTYDLVSLLRDCYIHWPQKDIDQLAIDQLRSWGFTGAPEEGLKNFDLMGLQRHIKVLGIFSRLAHRDKKDGYLKDLPLVLAYVLTIADRYPETRPLADWLKTSGITQKLPPTELN